MYGGGSGRKSEREADEEQDVNGRQRPADWMSASKFMTRGRKERERGMEGARMWQKQPQIASFGTGMPDDREPEPTSGKKCKHGWPHTPPYSAGDIVCLLSKSTPDWLDSACSMQEAVGVVIVLYVAGVAYKARGGGDGQCAS